jgi:hypothetical protein
MPIELYDSTLSTVLIGSAFVNNGMFYVLPRIIIIQFMIVFDLIVSFIVCNS